MNDERRQGSPSSDGSKGRGAKSRWASFRVGWPLLHFGQGFSIASEQYRMIALQVEEAAKAIKGRGIVVAVTSPDAAVGKTTTSLNLALTVARRGEKKVLVIESDLWKPQFEEMLTMSGAPVGLSDLLSEDKRQSLDRCVVSIWSTGLDLLVGGAGTKDGDLVTSNRMAGLIDEAASTYDVVILDSPPFGLASGQALATMSDGVLVVVGARKTRRKGIESVLSRVGPQKALGLVLNNARGLDKHYSNYPDYRGYAQAAEPPQSRSNPEGKNSKGPGAFWKQSD